MCFFEQIFYRKQSFGAYAKTDSFTHESTQRGCFLVVSSSGQVLLVGSFGKKSKTLLVIKLLQTLLPATPFVCLFVWKSFLAGRHVPDISTVTGKYKERKVQVRDTRNAQAGLCPRLSNILSSFENLKLAGRILSDHQ